MRTLILLSAIPGSGKSTWAKKYKEGHNNTYIVSSDDIREELFGSPECFANEKLVWKTFEDRLNEHVEDMSDLTVIADATHLTNKLRKMYVELTPKFDKHLLVIFNIPFETSLKQNQMRDRVVPLNVMHKLRNEYEEPDEEVKNCYDDIIYISDFVAK